MMFPRKLFRCMIFLLLSAMARSCGTSCYHSLGASSEVPTTSPTGNATIFARCHAACVDKFYASRVAILARSSVWPSISTTSLQSNCDTFSQVMECRRGCVERGREYAKISECRNSSLNSCKSEKECGNNSTCTYEGTTCEVQCSPKSHKTGCRMGSVVFSLDQDQASPQPPAPLSAPALVRSESPTREYDAGVFNLSVQNPVMGGGDFANATGFLFRIEANQTSHFIFKMSLDEGQLLDLGNFACTEVNVSFAAVNGYGVSAYSPPSEVCVHGETHFPSQPTNLSYSWERDPRQDFPWHAVINISWDRPEGYEFVEHYILTLYSSSIACGTPNIHRFKIDADTTSFVLMARNTSEPPLTNSLCKVPYRIFLQSQPSQSSDDGLHKILIVEEDPRPPQINLTCNRIVDETTGNIAVLSLWTVGDDPRTVGAIDHYSIHVTIVQVDDRDIWILKEGLWSDPSVQSKEGSGSYVVHNILPHTNSDYKIRVSVSPAIAPNSMMDSSFLPDRKECLLSAAPEQPNPVNNETISVHEFAIRQGQLYLNLSWEQPELVYGNVTKYAVRITRDPVYPGEEPQDSAIVKLVELPTSEPFGLIDGGQIYVKDNTLCLYAQVQAKNIYVWSEWSNPVTLVRYPSLYPNCTWIPLPSPTVLDEVKQNVPLYVYIVAGVGGCVVIVLLMLTVIVVKLCKRHRMKKDMQRVFRERNGYQNPMFVANRSSHRLSRPSVSYKTLPKTDKWEIPAGHVIIEEWLGEGCFGEVRKGIVKGPIPNSQFMKSSICVTVAVKLLKSSATGSERTDFLHEIDTMKKIAKGNSPHVVGLVGCVTIQEPLCLITEFVKHGDLLLYLQTIRKLVTQRNHARKLAKQPEPYLVPTPQNPEAQDPEALGEAVQCVVPAPDSPYAELGEVEPVNLISFAYQIAHGMEYLSSLDIVHRDLACRNILVSENKVLKISDFGMAREVAGDDVYVKTSKGRLPWKWMAIESIINREFTSASDVWAYGVVLWEIATLGGFPYPMIPNSELLDHLKRGHRLESSENCSQEVYKIMLDCWSDIPDNRPTFAQLKAKFDTMLAEDNPYIQFDNINTCKSYYKGLSKPGDGNSVEMSEIETSEATGTSVSSSATLRDSGICSSGYDYLKPRIPEVNLEESLLHPITNPYVDTPTKLPYDSAFDLDIIDTQQTIHEDPESGDSAITELCEAV